MYFREARPLDVYTMGKIQAICNTKDTVARYSIQDMEKYWTTCVQSSTRFCKRRMASPGAVTFVVETETSDYTLENRHRCPEVVGFVIFDRIGTSDKAKEWQARNLGWYKSFNRALDSIEDRYLRMFPNVECTFKFSRYQTILPYLRIPFDEEIFAEAWEVDLFFVHPDWQRKGVGRKLMQWAFDRGNEEQVPVVVKSSARGGAAYQAMGFRSLGEVGLSELMDTLEFGGVEPQLWCWEPEGSTEQWYERGREALQNLLKEREDARKEKAALT